MKERGVTLFIAKVFGLVSRCFPSIPGHAFIVGTDHPALKHNDLGCADIRHRVGPSSKLAQAGAAVLSISLGLAGPVTAQHVDHDVIRLHAMSNQRFKAGEKPLLVFPIVPCGIYSARLESVIVVLNAGNRGGGVVIQHASIDVLIEADLEIPRANLVNALLPFWLPKEVVIKQMNMSWMRIATPDIHDRTLLADGTLFLRDNAKLATQTTAALCKADRRLEIGIDRIVLLLSGDIVDFQIAPSAPSCTANHSVRVQALQMIGKRQCIRENQGGIDAVEPIKQATLKSREVAYALKHYLIIPMVSSDSHQRDVRELTVQL